MKRLAKLRKGEAGYVLVWVLLVLIVAGLVLTPLLLLMGVSLTSSDVHEESTQRFYAADSGIEAGIWKALSGETDVPPYELNSCNVVVTMTEIIPTAAQRQDFGISEDAKVYEIISTATSVGDGSQPSTTIVSYINVMGGSGDYGGLGDLPVSGPLSEPGDIEIDEDVRVEGDITIGNGNLKIWGVDVIVEGDVDIGDGNLEVYDDSNLIVCGNVHVDENLVILGTGNVIIQGNLVVEFGNLEVNADTNLTVCGNVDVGGNFKGYGTFSVGGEGDPVEANVDVEGDFEVYGHGIVCGNVDVNQKLKVDSGAVLCVALDINAGDWDISGTLTEDQGCSPCPPEACPVCGTGETSVSVESYQLE